MTIRIRDLGFEAVIGILEFERERPQRVTVECDIDYDPSPDYLDYAAVVEHIKTQMIENRFGLIETAIESLQTSLKHRFPQMNVLTLSIAKPDILSDCIVSVSNTFRY